MTSCCFLLILVGFLVPLVASLYLLLVDCCLLLVGFFLLVGWWLVVGGRWLLKFLLLLNCCFFLKKKVTCPTENAVLQIVCLFSCGKVEDFACEAQKKPLFFFCSSFLLCFVFSLEKKIHHFFFFDRLLQLRSASQKTPNILSFVYWAPRSRSRQDVARFAPVARATRLTTLVSVWCGYGCSVTLNQRRTEAWTPISQHCRVCEGTAGVREWECAVLTCSFHSYPFLFFFPLLFSGFSLLSCSVWLSRILSLSFSLSLSLARCLVFVISPLSCLFSIDFLFFVLLIWHFSVFSLSFSHLSSDVWREVCSRSLFFSDIGLGSKIASFVAVGDAMRRSAQCLDAA